MKTTQQKHTRSSEEQRRMVEQVRNWYRWQAYLERKQRAAARAR